MSHFFTLRLKNLFHAEDGQAIAFVAFGVMMLLLFAGLGVDVGYLRYQKQQMQKAADSAALAGAEALTYGSSYSAAGQNDATINGFKNGQNGITVAVNSPPQVDPIFKGQSGYVEAIVTQARPIFFMRVAGFGNQTVSARAVASSSGSGSGCIYALDPTDSKSMVLNGNVTVSASCGVYVNSSSSSALVENGNSGSLTASGGIGVVGPSGGGGWSGSNLSPTPVNIPPFTDPLANLAEPTVPGCNGLPNHYTGSATLPPGTYCGGLKLSGNGTVNFTPGGVYIMCGGGMSSTGGEVLNGTGVTFYNTGNVQNICPGNNYSPVSITGGAGGTLAAPTTGTYAGILFFQDRAYQSTKNNDASSIDGSAGATFTGAMYFPGTGLTFAGTPNAVVSSLIIAYQITINGNTSINDNLLVGGGSPIQTAVLAE
jgi:Putative Flp pilus-assembly TadE/G-like